jgi:predicted dehydrogenase
MNHQIPRRRMLGGVAAASAMRVMGSNDRIRLAAIGVGWRGEYLMQRANAAGGIEWAAVCDAYDLMRDKAEKTAGVHVDKYADYRRVIDRKDIDAVILATWDNTHCDIAVPVLESGKDLFVEKPMTLHPMEGHRIVKAVRAHKRILQTGTQQRSHPHFARAKEEFIDSGRIGKITCVRTHWNSNLAYRNQKPPAGMERKPAGLDWDACQGRLPKRPWDPKRYFNHYVYWDYSTNAQMGGLFVHMIDVVHWYCKVLQPLAADCFGGIYLGGEGRDTADHINAIVEYPNNLLVTFEANVADGIRREHDDMVFMGSGGRLHIFRYGYRFLATGDGGKSEIRNGTTPDLHVANWLECIRSRKKAACDEEAGHYSAMACHVCNLAYKQRRRVQWNKEWNI